MIPTPPCDKKVSKIRDASVSEAYGIRSRSIRRYPTYNEVVGTSPHQEYITRHMNIQKKGCDNRVSLYHTHKYTLIVICEYFHFIII